MASPGTGAPPAAELLPPRPLPRPWLTPIGKGARGTPGVVTTLSPIPGAVFPHRLTWRATVNTSVGPSVVRCTSWMVCRVGAEDISPRPAVVPSPAPSTGTGTTLKLAPSAGSPGAPGPPGLRGAGGDSGLAAPSIRVGLTKLTPSQLKAPSLKLRRRRPTDTPASQSVRSRSCTADVKAREATDAEDRAEPAEGGVTVGGDGGGPPACVCSTPQATGSPTTGTPGQRLLPQAVLNSPWSIQGAATVSSPRPASTPEPVLALRRRSRLSGVGVHWLLAAPAPTVEFDGSLAVLTGGWEGSMAPVQ